MEYYSDKEDVGSYSDGSADYDENDRFARRYGDKKRSEHYDYQHSDEVSDQEDYDDKPYKEKALNHKRASRYQKKTDYDSDSESDAKEAEAEKDEDKKKRRKFSFPLNKESTVQELILTHLTNLKTMILVSTQYLNRLEKKFKSLVGNKITSLQFKGELARMLEEIEEDQDDDDESEQDDDDDESSVEDTPRRRQEEKKRKRSQYSSDDSDSESYDRNKTNKKAFRSGTKRVKIVDSDDKPVNLKDLASNLGIKKSNTTTNNNSGGRIMLGKGSDSTSDVVAIGTTLSNIPLVPGRKDPVLKTKSYVAPKNI